MNNNNISNYFPESKIREEMWKDCMFVFDTSALLSFYELSTKSQENIFATTFTKIKNRLWIPGHVEFEYLKNRKNVITNIYNDKYKKLNEQHFNQITKHIEDINSIVDDLSNKTKKQDAHPYIDTLIVNDFRNSCNVFKENYNLFKEKFDKEISKIKEEIDDKLNHDNVLNEFNKSFVVGKDFAYTQIMEIVKEGELRYRNQIPPGYEDSENKVGFQKYGDLIIWKQIISFAKETKKSIVFIVNDTKEDWCYKCKRSKENRIERPREELIKEIKDEANVDFWMYTLSQFLYSADILLKTKINKSAIEEVEIVEQYQQKSTINRKDNYFGEIRKGDIYYADLSPVVGSELGGIRPIVIIQNNIGNKYSPTVIVAGITSQINKAKLPTHVEISLEAYGLNKKSVVLLEQMRTLDKGRLKEKIGHLNDYDMKKINKALLIEVGL